MGIHLRLGSDAKENFGFSQPKPIYYLKALRELQGSSTDATNIVIFSDEPGLAKSYVRKYLDIKNPIFFPGNQFTPAENLYLMSQVNSLICANSTFSTWAGWSVGNRNGRVLIPVPFSDYHNMGSREFPRTWIQIGKN